MSDVILEPMSEAHVSDALVGWLNDKELMKYSRQRLFDHSKETSLAYLRSFSGTPNHYWAVISTAGQRLIGTLNAYVSIENEVGDMGLLIGDVSVRGKGHGRQAWLLGMNYLFRELGLRKVTGGTSALNRAMVTIFERSGMIMEGCRREQELINGVPSDVVLYGILRREWEERSN